MLRIRLSLPPPHTAQTYTHQDLIHDALINSLEASGCDASDLMGLNARVWTFAPIGWHKGHQGFVHSLIISTSDFDMARALTRLKPETIIQRRWNGETLNFANAQLSIEPDPLFPHQTQLACLLVSRQLSVKAGRPIQLKVQPDALYLRANPRHSVLVNLKQLPNGHKSFVIGMQAPLLLEGSEDDLRFAWYSGIGEKTRNGFGCLGLLEQGVH
jgi:CRISPR/Cas system endoribonuclease Cas6 (RAMP superfamily)